jgi:hypothetical protein
MAIAFEDIDLPLVETVLPEDEEDDDDIEDDAASNAGSEMSMSEYGGSVTELPPWMLFGKKECRYIFELGQDKAVFYRVCGNVAGACKRPGHATGDKAAIGYYEPVKARKYVDGRLNTFLSTEEFAGKERERIEAKTREMALASARLGPLKDSPTGSEEELYFQARPADTRLLAHQPRDSTMAADPFEIRKIELKKEGTKNLKPSLKSPPKYSEDNKFVAKLSAVDTNFDFKEEPGLVHSPTLKKLQATGLKADSMDPATVMMMAMVDQLTTSMAKLTTQVEGLASAPKPTMEEPKPKKPKVAKAPVEDYSEPKPKHYYGVGHGLEGAFGVYTSWGEAAPLVVGVSKAIFQRFGTWQEANEFVTATQALRKERIDSQPTGTPDSDVWYSVTNSKTGYYEIFPSWPAAQLHVVNVSGASVKKFRTYCEAQDYVNRHASAWELKTANSPRPEEPSRMSQQPPFQAPAPTPHVIAAPSQFNRAPQLNPGTPAATPSGGALSLYPPGMLMGEDPSTGKTDELFKIDIDGSEEELQDALCPPDLSEAMAKSLINGTIDSVALPGGLNNGGELEGTSSDVGMLGEALEELVTQSRGAAGKSGRSDLRWRNEKRTSIRSINSEIKLRTRIKHLKKLMPKVQKRMETLVATSCKRSGWTDQIRIHTWSSYGYLPVIVMSSLRGYLALHEHLLELAIECGWDYISTELDHHVEEMELIRTLADTRIHAICSLYCYLRDCKDKSWYSTSIQQKRNVAMVTGSSPRIQPQFPPSASEIASQAEPRSTGMAALCCMKCHTCLHTGGANECPWKNQSDDNARKAGAKALKNLANGNSTRNTGNGGRGNPKEGD